MDEPNYLGEAGNKSHGDGNYELFSATGKESCSSVQMDADLIHWLSEDTVIYLFQSTEMASKNPHSAADIQNKCDCTLIFLDGISQLLNSQ